MTSSSIDRIIYHATLIITSFGSFQFNCPIRYLNYPTAPSVGLHIKNSGELRSSEIETTQWSKKMTDENLPKLKILRRKELVALVGLSISACYEKMNVKSPRYDASFPKSVKLGKKAVGWVEAEVVNWIHNQMQLR